MPRAGALRDDDEVAHERVRIDGEPLDPPPGLVLMLHKPAGYTCSTTRCRSHRLRSAAAALSPALADRSRVSGDSIATRAGLLLMTDDGALLHRIVRPKSHLAKVYEATLARDLRGDEAAIFASGKLMLESETTPLAPACMEVLAPRRARLTLTEGRYHQVRRMFAAVGNHVEELHRSRIGGLDLGDLASGQWRVLAEDDVPRLFVAD